MIDAADICIPKVKSTNNKGMPGWNQYVQPYKDQSILWNNIWLEAGCPDQGELASLRKYTKKKYHSAIKFIKRNKDDILKYKTAHLLNNKKFTCFWKEMKNLKRLPNSLPSRIENSIGDESIVNCFKDKYEYLYNSVNDVDLGEIKQTVNQKLSNCLSGTCVKTHEFTMHNMTSAISSLKNFKHDHIYGFYSNNIINGSDKLHNMLLTVFNAILLHGCTNEIFNRSIIVPLIKDKRKTSTSFDNYRAISLGSILYK